MTSLSVWIICVHYMLRSYVRPDIAGLIREFCSLRRRGVTHEAVVNNFA